MAVRTLFKGSAVLAIVSLVLPATAPAQSDQASKAGVVTSVLGSATVARTAAPEPAALRFKDDVFLHDRISTGDQSLARILLGGKAVVTVRERSQLTITETATTSTLEVTSGAIALSVNKARMRPGDSVEIKTPNAVAGIRGTVIIAEVDPPETPSTPAATRFTLLTGVVDVTLLDPSTGRPTGPAVTMNPLQTLAVTGFTPPTAPRPITRGEADRIAGTFAAPLPQPSPSTGANAGIVDNQVQEASRRGVRVTGDTGKAKLNDAAASGSDSGNGNGGAGNSGAGNSAGDNGSNGTASGNGGNGNGNTAGGGNARTTLGGVGGSSGLGTTSGGNGAGAGSGIGAGSGVGTGNGVGGGSSAGAGNGGGNGVGNRGNSLGGLALSGGNGLGGTTIGGGNGGIGGDDIRGNRGGRIKNVITR